MKSDKRSWNIRAHLHFKQQMDGSCLLRTLALLGQLRRLKATMHKTGNLGIPFSLNVIHLCHPLQFELLLLLIHVIWCSFVWMTVLNCGYDYSSNVAWTFAIMCSSDACAKRRRGIKPSTFLHMLLDSCLMYKSMRGNLAFYADNFVACLVSL